MYRLRLLLILVGLLLVSLVGCQSSIKSAQLEAGIFNWSVSKSDGHFYGRFGTQIESESPAPDLSPLVERWRPRMEVLRRGRVRILYLPEHRHLAFDLARYLDRLYRIFPARLGFEIGFPLEVPLVPVARYPEAFQFWNRASYAVWPLMIRQGDTLAQVFDANVFPYTLIHELTEATLTTGRGQQEGNPLLNDVRFWIFEYANYTRWFREGVSNYAGLVAIEECRYLFERDLRLPHPYPLIRLEEIGPAVLEWTQFPKGHWRGHPIVDYYAASLGLVLELVGHSGEDVLGRILERLKRHEYGDREALLEAVEAETGLDLERFLEHYQRPWLGMELVETVYLPGDLERGEEMAWLAFHVKRVVPDSPAWRAGLRADDLIVGVGGEKPISIVRLQTELARRGEGSTLELQVVRGDRHPVPCRVTIARRPLD